MLLALYVHFPPPASVIAIATPAAGLFSASVNFALPSMTFECATTEIVPPCWVVYV